MSKVYKNLNGNILIEWEYNSGDIIDSSFSITSDINSNRIFISNSIPNLKLGDVLMPVDPLSNRWVNAAQLVTGSDKFSGGEFRLDRVTIRFKSDWGFGNILGISITNPLIFKNGSEITLLSTSILKENLESDNFLWAGSLWDRKCSFNLISQDWLINTPSEISKSIIGGNSISGNGPIVLDFRFIEAPSNLGGYILSDFISVDFPISDSERDFGVLIQESTEGDWFEIWTTYNGTVEGFIEIFNLSLTNDSKLVLNYTITTFEGNIPSRKISIRKSSGFRESIDFRPIIKRDIRNSYILVDVDVEDIISGETFRRSAVFGMTPHQIIKYHIDPAPIKTLNILKPKIWVNKTEEFTQNSIPVRDRKVVMDVDRPVIKFDRLLAKCDGCVIGGALESGDMIIKISPFNNKLKFTFLDTDFKPIDFLNWGELNLMIRGYESEKSFGVLYEESDPYNGTLVFNIKSTDWNFIRTSFNQGFKSFLITSRSLGKETTIYWGMFITTDSVEWIDRVNINNAQLGNPASGLSVGEINLEEFQDKSIIIKRRRI